VRPPPHLPPPSSHPTLLPLGTLLVHVIISNFSPFQFPLPPLGPHAPFQLITALFKVRKAPRPLQSPPISFFVPLKGGPPGKNSWRRSALPPFHPHTQNSKTILRAKPPPLYDRLCFLSAAPYDSTFFRFSHGSSYNLFIARRNLPPPRSPKPPIQSFPFFSALPLHRFLSDTLLVAEPAPPPSTFNETSVSQLSILPLFKVPFPPSTRRSGVHEPTKIV